MLDLSNKKILIAGLGLSGKAVLDTLSGAGVHITVFDDRDIKSTDPQLFKKLELAGNHSYFNGDKVPDEKWDYVIMSPGISMDSVFVSNAQRQGAKVIGELELAYEMSSGKYVAITGTNGKTTTTTLVGEIFKNAKMKTIVGGNIGIPLISAAGKTDNDTIMVTEVSSFQLESIIEFKPHVAAILNLTPDHLDRHKTMENYGAVKGSIFKNQTSEDFLIYNYDDEKLADIVFSAKSVLIPFSRVTELEKGAFVKDGIIVIKDTDGKQVDILKTSELKIPGSHNLENALAAAAIGFFGGVDPDTIIETLKEFEGVSHRLELVSVKKGIRFINDSKGTNPDASMKAIDAVGDGIFLIAGGYDKGSDFHDFIENFNGRVKHLLLIGETSEQFRRTAAELGFNDVTVCQSLAESVRAGYENAEEGDTVLLSPASASWDMYKNFEERGDHFRIIVEELK